MSAQWIIKGLDPAGASVVTPSRAHKYTNTHPFRAVSQEHMHITACTHRNRHSTTNAKPRYLLTPPDN